MQITDEVRAHTGRMLSGYVEPVQDTVRREMLQAFHRTQAVALIQEC
jgi:hypothetical protein